MWIDGVVKRHGFGVQTALMGRYVGRMVDDALGGHESEPGMAEVRGWAPHVRGTLAWVYGLGQIHRG